MNNQNLNTDYKKIVIIVLALVWCAKHPERQLKTQRMLFKKVQYVSILCMYAGIMQFSD